MKNKKLIGIVAVATVIIAAVGYVTYRCNECLKDYDDLDFEDDDLDDDFINDDFDDEDTTK